MTVIYLASFIAGLLLAVRVMIFGVERPQDERRVGEPLLDDHGRHRVQ